MLALPNGRQTGTPERAKVAGDVDACQATSRTTNQSKHIDVIVATA
jgi:hypothetical protein